MFEKNTTETLVDRANSYIKHWQLLIVQEPRDSLARARVHTFRETLEELKRRGEEWQVFPTPSWVDIWSQKPRPADLPFDTFQAFK